MEEIGSQGGQEITEEYFTGRNTSQGDQEIKRAGGHFTGYTDLTALHTTDGRQPCASHRPAPHLSWHAIMHEKDNLTEVAISCASEIDTLIL
jgi:hypothetical protein